MGDKAHGHPVDPSGVEAARARLLAVGDARQVAELAALVTEPVRARVLRALSGVDELCVGDLALALGVSEDAVSYALRLLRTGGFVRRRKAGRVVFYRVADGGVSEDIAAVLGGLLRLAHERGEAEGG